MKLKQIRIKIKIKTILLEFFFMNDHNYGSKHELSGAKTIIITLSTNYNVA